MFSKSLLLVLFAINTSLDMKKCRGGGGGYCFRGWSFTLALTEWNRVTFLPSDWEKNKEAAMRVTSLPQEMQSIALPADKKIVYSRQTVGSMHIPSQMG